jgi:peptidylprolyl isomerase
MMRKGDRWELYIPRDLAYGKKTWGMVPANADLIVEVELMEVNVEQVKGQMFELRTSAKVLCFTVIGLILVLYHHFFWVSQASAREGSSARPRGPRLPLDLVAGLASNPRVFFDMEVSGKPAGRLEFELFSSVVPRTAENFRALTTGERGVSSRSGARLHYKGSRFHRILPGFMCQGGDFEHGNGEGGESIYGPTFKDEWEHGVVTHSIPGLLSMANRGEDTNGAQFFITVASTPWLDDKHVVFGRVIRGMDVLKHLEALGTKSGRPREAAVIANCGRL